MANAARRAQRLSAEARRKQLRESGVRVAARLGLYRTVHAEVAREAKVSIATVFKYFATTPELLTAIVLEVGQFYEAIAEASYKPDCDAHSRSMRHVQMFLDSIDSHREYALVWLEWSASARNESSLWDLYLAHHSRILAYMRTATDEILPQNSEEQREDQVRLLHALTYPLLHLKLTGASASALAGLIRMGLHPRPMSGG